MLQSGSRVLRARYRNETFSFRGRQVELRTSRSPMQLRYKATGFVNWCHQISSYLYDFLSALLGQDEVRWVHPPTVTEQYLQSFSLWTSFEKLSLCPKFHHVNYATCSSERKISVWCHDAWWWHDLDTTCMNLDEHGSMIWYNIATPKFYEIVLGNVTKCDEMPAQRRIARASSEG